MVRTIKPPSTDERVCFVFNLHVHAERQLRYELSLMLLLLYIKAANVHQ